MFILKDFNIEVKRTDSLVRKFISKRTHVYIKDFKYRSEANRFVSDFVLEITKKSKKRTFVFLNERQKTKVFDNELAKFCHS
jgi:hypothetical protein